MELPLPKTDPKEIEQQSFFSLPLVQDAYAYGKSRYKGLKSVSGKPAIEHNLESAKIASNMTQDPATIAACLLHDATERGIPADEIKEVLGEDVNGLVSAREKFKIGVKQTAAFSEKENMGKLILALTKDLRLVFVEFACRLQNLRRLNELPEEVRIKLLREAKEVFSPLAHKLGIYQVKAEMEDQWFKHSMPEKCEELNNKIREREKLREIEIANVKKIIELKLNAAGIDCRVEGRAKHTYSIYEKMNRKNKTFEEIYDITAVRVITNSIKNCYEILGIVHSIWRPLATEFDDYIAKPKPNMYQSLHTTVIGPARKPVEIQIRTEEMHRVAELGIAAHWRYKGTKSDERYDKKLSWMKQMLEWQRTNESGNVEDVLKTDFFGDDIFVLTPKGEVIELPEGSTALDFAYAVHTEVGNHCQKIKINGKIVPIGKILNNTDVIEVITSIQQQPKRHWLNIVKTTKAKTKIRQKLHLADLKKKRAGKLLLKKDTIKSTDRRVRLCRCCNPLPGDEIIGFLTTKRKISVHRLQCREVPKISLNKTLIGIDWGKKKGEDYAVTMTINAKERAGLLTDVLSKISRKKISVTKVGAKSAAGNTLVCNFDLKVKDLKEFEAISQKISKVEGVNSVKRE